MSRRRVAALSLMLVACASRAPSVGAPKAPPAADVPAPRFPAPTAKASDGEAVERIYALAPTASAPALGGEDAKVRLEVCGDFASASSAAFVATLHELHESYGELVRIVWRDCPAAAHPVAMSAAEAAHEVHAQRGDAAFWAYHDQLFSHQAELAPARLVSLAATLDGVDAARVEAALRDRRHLPAVQAELAALRDAGATEGAIATPTTFVNGRMMVGAQSSMAFEDAIERALQETPEAHEKAVEQSALAYPMARVRHLLVQYAGARGAPTDLARTRDEARARSEALSLRAAAGESFEALVRRESECPSGREGGVVGRFTRGELPPLLDVALFSLAPGQVSEPVESAFGFHLLKRED